MPSIPVFVILLRCFKTSGKLNKNVNGLRYHFVRTGAFDISNLLKFLLSINPRFSLFVYLHASLILPHIPGRVKGESRMSHRGRFSVTHSEFPRLHRDTPQHGHERGFRRESQVRRECDARSAKRTRTMLRERRSMSKKATCDDGALRKRACDAFLA